MKQMFDWRVCPFKWRDRTKGKREDTEHLCFYCYWTAANPTFKLCSRPKKREGGTSSFITSQSWRRADLLLRDFSQLFSFCQQRQQPTGHVSSSSFSFHLLRCYVVCPFFFTAQYPNCYHFDREGEKRAARRLLTPHSHSVVVPAKK